MNIFQFFNRSGKIALSAMQAVGITAVVGVSGLAAWQLLSTPAEDNDFNPAAQYSSGEVVYVSNANTGGYAGAPGNHSSVQVSANTLKRLDRQAMAEQAALEMEEEFSQAQVSSAASAPSGQSAYQMGGTEGLGMAGNFANEDALAGNPMAAMSKSMSGISDMVAKAQQQAQAAQNGAAEGKAAFATASPNWSGKSGGGNGFNASFEVQNSGKNKGGNAAQAGRISGSNQNVFASAQEQLAATTEGARIRSRASFGASDPLKNADRRSSVAGGRNSKDANDLEFIRKRSADAANNRYRSANEAGRAFLASTPVSGVQFIEGEITTGQDQGTRDFNNEAEIQMRGIQAKMGEIGNTELDRLKDRMDLQKKMWWAVGISLTCMLGIVICKTIEPWGIYVALGLAAVLSFYTIRLGVYAGKFIEKWGFEGMGSASLGVAAALLAAGWLSFAYAGAIKDAAIKVGKAVGKIAKKIMDIVKNPKEAVRSLINSIRNGTKIPK